METLDRRCAGVWRPNWSGVREDELDVLFVSRNESLFAAAPGRAGKKAERLELRLAGFCGFSSMSAEAEMRIPVDASEARPFVERDFDELTVAVWKRDARERV